MTDLTKITSPLGVPNAVWALLPPEYKWAAGGKDGEVWVYDARLGAGRITFLVGVTFDKSRWKESLVQRPEGEYD